MVELTTFEKLIVKAMAPRLVLLEEEAEHIVRKYLLVIRDMKDTQDSAKIQAERYFNAHEKDVDPHDWLERNMKLKKATDPTLIKTPMAVPTLKKVHVVEVSLYNFNEVVATYTSKFDHEPTQAEIILCCQHVREVVAHRRVSAEVYVRYDYSEEPIE